MNIMSEHEEFLKLAIQLAEDNVKMGNGGPFGCVIVRKGEIVATAVNSVTSSNDPTAHAEVKAIRKSCEKLNTYQLKECTIYSSCEPCPMCLGAIYWARPQAVYFAASRFDAADAGFDDEFIYREIAASFESRQIPMKIYAVSEKLNPFIQWDKTEFRKEY